MSDTPGAGDALVSLSDERAVLDILTKSVFGLWDTVNNLTRLRPTKRERYRVTIFGSARIDPNHWVYGAVRDTAAELTRLGNRIEAPHPLAGAYVERLDVTWRIALVDEPIADAVPDHHEILVDDRRRRVRVVSLVDAPQNVRCQVDFAVRAE